MKITYEQLADKIFDWITSLLSDIGLSHTHVEKYGRLIYVAIIILSAVLIAVILRIVLIYIIHKWIKFRGGPILKGLVREQIFTRMTHMIPPLVIITLLPFAFNGTPDLLSIIEKFCWIYFIGAFIFSLNSFITVLWHIISNNQSMRNRPMKGLVQIIKGIIIGLGVIVSVSILLNSTPMHLLTGLGAFAAVLMLVFKDSILGFVAGVQLSQNDMVRNGDWIVVPNTPVNGVIIDVSLNTVKVQNFDNTIVTVPPYSLISGSFQNWRGMSESGGRRIMRSYTVDVDTIRFCTPEMLEDLKSIPYLKEYIDKKEAQQANNEVQNTDNKDGLVNGTIETNLGLFRAYMTLYLQHHPFINQELTLMVRTLNPTDNGLPVQVYCFSANKVWEDYEAIQAEIMEHFAAIMPRFNLFPFQNASGRDYINTALITAGNKPEDIVGLPWGSIRKQTAISAKQTVTTNAEVKSPHDPVSPATTQPPSQPE